MCATLEINKTILNIQEQVKLKFNALSCPQCSNLLFDNLEKYEKGNEIKSVSCVNCDFTSKRKGFRLLTLEEIKDIATSLRK